MAETSLRKVTVLLPSDLVARATAASGQGITPTIRLGLEAIAARDVYAKWRELRGKVKIEVDLDELRRD